MKLREINIKKPPARRPRAKADAIPLTGEPHPDLTPKRPAWIRWMVSSSGTAIPIRIPGFMYAIAPRGHVPEGSPEEAAMKKELGL